MDLLTYILILGFQHQFRVVLGRECIQTGRQESTLNKLKDNLFKSGYDSNFPPKGPNSERTTVTVKFILRYFSININEDVFNMQPWTFMHWRDCRLKWDPTNYGNLDEIEVQTKDLWTPVFKIFNSWNTYDDLENYYVPCSLRYTGDVICELKTSHMLHCDIKLTDFPYDAQQCTFVVDTLHHNGYNVTFGSRAMSLLGVDYGSSWFISGYKQDFQRIPDARLNITLVIEREAQGLAAIVVYPALIISSLTVACLFLDIRLNERLLFICFSIFSHCYWLRELVENLPKLSEKPPRILLYYRGSLLITVFILLLTLILSVMSRSKNAPHNSVIFINKLVYSSYLRFLVYPRWELTDDGNSNEAFTKLSNSVNSLCIIVIVFSYIGMCIAFIPHPIPFVSNEIK